MIENYYKIGKNTVMAVLVGVLAFSVLANSLMYSHLKDSEDSKIDNIERDIVGQRLDGNEILFLENVDFGRFGITFDGGIENAYLIAWDNENAFVFRYISENFHVHDNRIFWEG